MEWKKVKSILLLILICTNLFLCGNLLLQIGHARASQRQAMNEALALLRNEVGDFDEEMFRQMGTRQPVLMLQRTAAKEKNAAKQLIGTEQLDPASGGGVSVYKRGNSHVEFRPGGQINMEIEGKADAPPEAYFTALLKNAGFPMDHSQATVRGNEVIFQQYSPSDAPILGYTLTCSEKNGMLLVDGYWLMETDAETVGEGWRGYQMVMGLRGYLQKQEIKEPPQSVELVYKVRLEGNEAVWAVPAWRITTKSVSFEISSLDGETKADQDAGISG